MEYFAIVSFDIADSADGRARAQDEHRARIKALADENRLLTAGPMPKTDEYGRVVDGMQGSLIVAQFESLDAARQWAQVDPYQAEGVYMESNVYPYKKVF